MMNWIFFSLVIGQNGLLALFGAEITAVAIELFLRAVHQTGRLGDVVDIGCGGTRPVSLSTAMCPLQPKYH